MAKKEASKPKDITPKKTTERKKPGPKKGTPSNNPFGRPVGAKNKVPNQVKLLLEEFAVDKFYQFKQDFQDITDPIERAKLYEKIASRFIPRPMNEEEANANKDFETEFMRRLFGAAKKEEDGEDNE
ncbi:hypothetical protein [Dysgonomonas sp. 511]|uniref:hypothetical protein n=1 Tax=Dysgonomonas sp. 511 TaxID=2302930 RepID=UPI0013D27F81|nr:hypothetical protein [Dysgonomonas sp. 511]NDV77856.1 hypothetical protein [Dysgonomonas sp. 511]